MKWQGVFPAITTPFQEDLSLDLDFLPRHLEAMLAAGLHGLRAARVARRVRDAHARREGRRARRLPQGARRPRRARGRDRRALDGGGGRDGAPGRRKGLRRAHGPAAVRVPAGPARDGGALLGGHRRDEAAVHALQQPDRVRDRRLGRRSSPSSRAATRTSPRSRSRAGTCAASPRSAPLLGDRLAIFVGVDDLIVEGVAAGAVGWIAGLVNALPRGVGPAVRPGRRGQARRGARALRVVPAAAAPGRRPEVRAAHQARAAGVRDGLGTGASAAARSGRSRARRGARRDPGAPRASAEDLEKPYFPMSPVGIGSWFSRFRRAAVVV